MRHWLCLGALLGALVGCDDEDDGAAPPRPFPDFAVDQAVDQAVDAARDATVDAARDADPVDQALDQALDGAPDQASVDMAVDFEPFEIGPSPFDLDAGTNPETLGTEVLEDWVPVLDDLAMMKRIAIRIDTPDPDLALTVPVRLVAPVVGCPCDFIVTHGGFAEVDAPDDAFSRWALENRIGLVIPAVAPLDVADPAFSAALDARLAATGDVRFTPLYLWSWTYIRAATAAVAEPDYFRDGRFGAFGRSRAGMAATAAVIHDSRFVALNTWLTPIAKLPPGLLTRPEGMDGRAWRRLQFDTARMALPIEHVAHLDTRRVNYFWHVGANDPLTPGLLEAERRDREFPLCIEPSVQHGEIAIDGSFAQPGPPRFEAMREATFRATFARGYRLMTPPLINSTVVNDTLTVLARYQSSPYGNDGTLWYAIDRVDPDDPAYVDTRWERVPMTRTDNRTFVATLPAPVGARHMDVFTAHSDVQNDARRSVTSGYARIVFEAQ